MNKQILIPYDEYIELSSDANLGKALSEDLKDITKVEQVYRVSRGEYVTVINIDSEKLKEIIKRFIKVDEINII